jgi:hypothetical protein
LTQDVEITILVDCQVVIPSYALLYQVHTPVHFAVYERAVHIVVDVDDLFRSGDSGFFNKAGHQRIESAMINLPEYHPKTAGIKEHVISIAEHDVVSSRMLEAGVARTAHPAMRLFVVFDLERVK